MPTFTGNSSYFKNAEECILRLLRKTYENQWSKGNKESKLVILLMLMAWQSTRNENGKKPVKNEDTIQ